MEELKERVCYYSNDDMSIRSNLELAELRINEFIKSKKLDNMTKIIELYNIKQLFDNNLKLTIWSNEKFESLKKNTSDYSKYIAEYLKSINPEKIVDEYNHLSWFYQTKFWGMINQFNFYDLIDSNALISITSTDQNAINEILHFKRLVQKKGNIIYNILMNDIYSAPLLLDNFVANRNLITKKEMFFPTQLTLKDKEHIINNYINSDNPNLNYIRLISQIKNDNNLNISPKTRLKAKKIEEKLNDECLKDPRTIISSNNFSIELVEEEKKALPVTITKDNNGNYKFKYSLSNIKLCNNTERIKNCISLFNWMNHHSFLNLISKKTEIETLESIITDKGRNSYPSYQAFNLKNDLALYQTLIYSKGLEKIDSSFEYELKKYYEEHLLKEYGFPGLMLNISNTTNSWLNKCRNIYPELDSIVKQYTTFGDEGEIDSELIMLSSPLKITEGKSLLEKKYLEINTENSEINKILYYLFAPASLLAFTEKYKKYNYHCLINLLENESVEYHTYTNTQKKDIDFLISMEVLFIDKKIIKYNKSKIALFKSIWEYNTCSYWHYSEIQRSMLDTMINNNWLIIDNHLLCKEERDYFSYYLDNSKFTNGYAYRNHYAHGSSAPSDKKDEHIKAYMTFIRLLSILLLKIDDDLFLARRIIAINETKE